MKTFFGRFIEFLKERYSIFLEFLKEKWGEEENNGKEDGEKKKLYWRKIEGERVKHKKST